jgi:hypothetical protein
MWSGEFTLTSSEAWGWFHRCRHCRRLSRRFLHCRFRCLSRHRRVHQNPLNRRLSGRRHLCPRLSATRSMRDYLQRH